MSNTDTTYTEWMNTFKPSGYLQEIIQYDKNGFKKYFGVMINKPISETEKYLVYEGCKLFIYERVIGNHIFKSTPLESVEQLMVESEYNIHVNDERNDMLTDLICFSSRVLNQQQTDKGSTVNGEQNERTAS